MLVSVLQTGASALHISCRENLLSVVQSLCAAGCNVDSKTEVSNGSSTVFASECVSVCLSVCLSIYTTLFTVTLYCHYY